MSAAEPHEQPHAPIYPPDEALRKARPLPPREDLVDEDLLDVPLVSHDGVFVGAPDLQLLTIAEQP